MLPDGSETLVRWIEKPKISDKTIKFKLDEDMYPYLLQLKEKFTTYEIKNILNMKSCYAPRLYEILKSYEFVHEVTYSIDELKKILCCENVKSYDLNINPALDNYNDLLVKKLEEAEIFVKENPELFSTATVTLEYDEQNDLLYIKSFER